MKKLKLTALVVLLLCAGCTSTRIKQGIGNQRCLLEEYNKRMDAGSTTPEQDKAALKAQLHNMQALDHYFNKATGPDLPKEK